MFVCVFMFVYVCEYVCNVCEVVSLLVLSLCVMNLLGVCTCLDQPVNLAITNFYTINKFHVFIWDQLSFILVNLK